LLIHPEIYHIIPTVKHFKKSSNLPSVSKKPFPIPLSFDLPQSNTTTMAETPPPPQENNNSLPNFLLPAYTTRNLPYHTRSPFPDVTVAPRNLLWSLLSFLSTAQNLNIDFLPITWAPALGDAGRGGTSKIHQSLVNVEAAFAYKRLIYSAIQEEKAFQALIAEISILGQGGIRRHGNVVRLEGVCWDVVNSTDNEEEKVWPVLVFEKAGMGSLEFFMQKGKGKNLGFEERVELCKDVGRGIWVMHGCCKFSL
jgi:hypothetical protein